MKRVIVINGRGGVGKDTICDILAKHYSAINVSSITPIKGIAMAHGWNGEKDAKSRKFLSDLKALFTEYNDMPNKYVLSRVQDFASGLGEILFVHIREGAEIAKFVEAARKIVGNMAEVRTLLVRRAAVSVPLGNRSDDDVEGYTYDWVYDNDLPLGEVEADIIARFKTEWK